MDNDTSSRPLPEALRARLDQVAGLLSSGQTQTALSTAVDTLREFPDNADLLNLTGVCAATLGQHAQAEQYWQQTIASHPNNAQAHFNLGLLNINLQRADQAEHYFRQAIEHDPRNAQALFQLGTLLTNQRRDDEAVQYYRRAIDLNPGHALFHTHLGLSLANLGQREEAERCYRQALAMEPGFAPAYNNLGLLLESLGRDDEAERCYRQAITLQPQVPIVYSNLALLLIRHGRETEGEQCLRQALNVAPDYAIARLNLGYLLLRQGRFAEGWQCHEARLDPRLPEKNRHPYPLNASFPQWKGESLAGKSLLVWPEQGLGDEIQFCRYLPLLKQQGASHITVVSKPSLLPLLRSLEGVDTVLPFAEDATVITPHDFWTCPLSIPLHCRTDLSSIPNQLPYLQVDSERITTWSTRLPRDGLRVGIVWKGGALHSNDANRSLPGLATLAPLWDIPGIHFIGLQKGQGEEEVQPLAATQPLLNLGPELADFADTAALVSQLDLVISVDTAVAHLAGALAKPCWILLPAQRSDWRWLKDRDDSPWYPGVMRLFRQGLGETWAPTVLAIQGLMRDIAANPHSLPGNTARN